MNRKARSLYGGIANTLDVPLTIPALAQEALSGFLFVHLTSKSARRRKKSPNKVIGLCAAMHVSGVLQTCSSTKAHELAVELFNSNLDGHALANHLMAIGGPALAEHPTLVELCDPKTAAPLFGKPCGPLLLLFFLFMKNTSCLRFRYWTVAFAATRRMGMDNKNATKH